MFLLWIAMSLIFTVALLAAFGRFLITPILSVLFTRPTMERHSSRPQAAKLATTELARLGC